MSRTKMRLGLSTNLPRQPPSNEPLLPWKHMRQHRLDVLAEMARLELLHEQTKVRIFGTGAVDDARRALREARRAFRRRR